MKAPWLRCGRAIAAVRLLLAGMFLFSFWIDPTQPTRREDLADLAVWSYLAFAFAMLAVAWKSWRLDTILALPALLLDGAVFLAGLYFTEGENSTFASPYVASFVFLVVCTLLRWGRRRAGMAVGVLVACYLLDCQVLMALGIDLDMLRMVRRLSYMVLIALAFVWITPEAGAFPVTGFAPPADVRSPEALLRLGLAHAMALTGADGGALAWGETEGLPGELLVRRDGAFTGTRLGPEAVELFSTPGIGPKAMVWAPATGHALWLSDAGAPVLGRATLPGLLAECIRGRDAIVMPFVTSSVEGTLLLWDIPGLCGGDLRLADRLQGDIESALDRSHISVLQERALVAQMRGALARDLHDGVAQSLAGALLRLEGLRNALQAGRDPFGNLDDAKAALRAEQASVREMIRQLREDDTTPPRAEPLGELGGWIEAAAAVWGVDAIFTVCCATVRLRQPMAFELRQLLREAIANAARHGKCRQVRISIDQPSRDSLMVTIEDDGCGFSGTGAPHSIAERMAALGGKLETGSAALGGARLVLSLPKAVAP